jgi:hypothetical protein
MGWPSPLEKNKENEQTMPTQNQIDDTVTAAIAVGEAQRAFDAAVAEVNRANAVSSMADQLITALEAAGADDSEIEPIVALLPTWRGNVTAKGEAFNAAGQTLSTAQTAYQTALSALMG